MVGFYDSICHCYHALTWVNILLPCCFILGIILTASSLFFFNSLSFRLPRVFSFSVNQCSAVAKDINIYKRLNNIVLGYTRCDIQHMSSSPSIAFLFPDISSSYLLILSIMNYRKLNLNALPVVLKLCVTKTYVSPVLQ